MMLIVVAGWLAMRMPGEGDVPGSGIVEKPSEPAAPVIAHQVEPLPVDSTSTEVEAALRPYCVAARAEVVMVSKRRGEPADVAMGGATLMSRDEDAAEIAMLFSNFDVAEVVMRGDVLMRASLGAMTH
jgi:hypothetical protein